MNILSDNRVVYASVSIALSLLMSLAANNYSFSQDWGNKRVLYGDNSVNNLPNVETVTIEFLLSDCRFDHLNPGKDPGDGVRSYYRINSRMKRKGCHIAGKFEYLDCNLKVCVLEFEKELDNISSLTSPENMFPGVGIRKVYPATITNCEEVKKTVDTANQLKFTVGEDVIRQKDDPLLTGKPLTFFFFGAMYVPVKSGALQIFTEPIEYTGSPFDFGRMGGLIFSANPQGLLAILSEEARKELEKELKPKGGSPTQAQVDQKATEWLNKMKGKPCSIFTSSRLRNNIARTRSESMEQLKEVILEMENTLTGLNIDDPELNAEIPITGKYYRHVVLPVPEQKVVPKSEKTSPKSDVIGVGVRGIP